MSGLRPHYLKAEDPDNGVFVRLGSTNWQADQDLVNELRRGVAGIALDTEAIPHLTFDDLNLEAAQNQFGTSRLLDEQALLSLKIATREQDRLVPNWGGVLLFGKEPEFHFPDAWIQCGRFIGKDMVDIYVSEN